MIRFLLAFLSWLGAFFRSRHDMGLELVALRQQVGVLKRKNPRPRLRLCDRLFWLGLRGWWSEWASALVIVKPETVVGWHRAGFHRYWRFLSPRRPGRPKISPRASQSHSINDGGESHLGSSPDPRRAVEIGIGNLRVHRLPLPGTKGARLETPGSAGSPFSRTIVRP